MVGRKALAGGVLVLVLLMLLEGREQQTAVEAEPASERPEMIASRQTAAEIQETAESDPQPDQPEMLWNE